MTNVTKDKEMSASSAVVSTVAGPGRSLIKIWAPPHKPSTASSAAPRPIADAPTILFVPDSKHESLTSSATVLRDDPQAPLIPSPSQERQTDQAPEQIASRGDNLSAADTKSSGVVPPPLPVLSDLSGGAMVPPVRIGSSGATRPPLQGLGSSPRGSSSVSKVQQATPPPSPVRDVAAKVSSLPQAPSQPWQWQNTQNSSRPPSADLTAGNKVSSRPPSGSLASSKGPSSHCPTGTSIVVPLQQRAEEEYVFIERGGPSRSLKKDWPTEYEDVMMDYISIHETETDREKRRRVPEAAGSYSLTRSRFMMELGLTYHDTIHPETGRSIMDYDDAKRAYYGHPDDAALLAFYAAIGKPQDDPEWLKTEDFLDEETAELRNVRRQRQSAHGDGDNANSSGTHLAANTSSSVKATSPEKRSLVASIEQEMRGASPTARDALIEEFRQSTTASNATLTEVVPLFVEDDYDATAPSAAAASGSPAWLIDMYYPNHALQSHSSTLELPQDAPAPSTSVNVSSLTPGSASLHTERRDDEATDGQSSVVYDKIYHVAPRIPVKPSTGTFVEYKASRGPSAAVSMPITERYRPATETTVGMSPILSGREYRNNIKRVFRERKEKGVATAPENVMTPRRPMLRGSRGSSPNNTTTGGGISQVSPITEDRCDESSAITEGSNHDIDTVRQLLG